MTRGEERNADKELDTAVGAPGQDSQVPTTVDMLLVLVFAFLKEMWIKVVLVFVIFFF